MLTGWKTVLFNIGVAISIPALNVLVDVNWVDLVGPTYAVAAVAAVGVAIVATAMDAAAGAKEIAAFKKEKKER